MQKYLIRCFDIVFSIFALCLFLPVFLIIAILVIKKMGFPIVFKQERLGNNGEVFTVFKYRSMINEIIEDTKDLEKVNEYTIKFKNDPRITPLGAFLRKTSLDELPQIWNVLRGDMSFVGPRPWVPQEYKNLPSEWHKRLEAKPGITGIAQINGRSDLAMEKIVEKDMMWVNNQTIGHYFSVLFKTVTYTLKMKNVY